MFTKFKVYGKFIKKNIIKIISILLSLILCFCFLVISSFAVTSYYPSTIFENIELYYDTLIGQEEIPDINSAYFVNITNDSNNAVVNGLFMDTNSFNNFITEDSYRVVSSTLRGYPINELKNVDDGNTLTLEFRLSVGFQASSGYEMSAGNLIGLSNNLFEYFQFRSAYVILNVTDSSGTRNITHPLSVSYDLVNTTGNENIFGSDYEYGNSPVVSKVVCGMTWKPSANSIINYISLVFDYGSNEFYDGLFVNRFYLQFQSFRYDINNTNSNVIGSATDKFYNDIDSNYNGTVNELLTQGKLTGDLIEEFDAFRLNRFNRSVLYLSKNIQRLYDSHLYIRYMYWSSIFIGIAGVLLGVGHVFVSRRRGD